MSDHTAQSDDSKYAWTISLTFWITLLIAVMLYSCVALAPKLLTNLELRSEYRTNQVRLVASERRIQYLERVSTALEHDPEFAAELARIDFDASRPGDERIAVSEELRIEARFEPPQPAVSSALPWYAPAVRVMAEEQDTRETTLFVACLLILFAFTFLHESQAGQFGKAVSTSQRAFRFVTNRYRSPTE